MAALNSLMVQKLIILMKDDSAAEPGRISEVHRLLPVAAAFHGSGCE